MVFENNQREKVHFISIGGAAMHSLALALHASGCRVTGSDDEFRDPSRSRLEKAGLLPSRTGWDPGRITPDVDAVILGMHARQDNPELMKALELGLPVYSFPEYIYERTKRKKRVVIGGSHGKTTVTSMIIHVLKRAGIKCDFLSGAAIEGFDNMAELSDQTELAVFEGDEYLSSALDPRPKFHLYRPHLAVITGIAWDHVNVFPSYPQYLEQFRIFAAKIEPSGSLVYCLEDPEVKRIAEDSRPDIRKIGYTTHPHLVEDGQFFLLRNGQQKIPVQLFGSHNMQNISASERVCSELGVSAEVFYEAIQDFKGAARRLQVLKENDDSAVYLDFAHAPSKVRGTVKAMRELHPKRRLIVCLELHTYSSLSSSFLHQYNQTLKPADEAVVFFDPAAADLKRLKRLSAGEIKKGFERPNLNVFDSTDALKDWLSSLDLHGSDLLFMSSGSFGGLDLPEMVRDLI